MNKYCIKVRVRKESLLDNEPFCHEDTYTAWCAEEAKKQMREHIWNLYECFDPEIISIIKL